MKLFLSYSYTEEDKWIEDIIFPLIKAFDIEITRGKEQHTGIISEEVLHRIIEADTVIAIFTRPWQTHPWVRDELIAAITKDKPAKEVKLRPLEPLGGIADGRQRIDFDLEKKELLLVELAGLLSEWRKTHETRSLLILPPEIIESARFLLEADKLKCRYHFMTGNKLSREFNTQPFQINKALVVNINNIPSPESYVKIVIEGPNFYYSCGYESFNRIPINLIKL